MPSPPPRVLRNPMETAAAAAMARNDLGGCSGLLPQLRFVQLRRRPVSVGYGLAAAASGRRSLLVASLQAMSAGAAMSEVVAQEEAENNASDGILLLPAVPEKMVHIRFVLQRKCMFGQRFFLVGNDPELGSWDPTKGIPLDWSEGHVWTTEMDLPANKLIEFKFVLRDSLGRVFWQNGPNRSLHTSETSNILVVYEDWDDAKSQKISEAELVLGMDEVVSLGVDISSNGSAMLVDGDQMGETQETQDESSVGKILQGMDDEKKPTIAEGNSILVPGSTQCATSTDSSLPHADEASSSQLFMDKETETPDDHVEEANIVYDGTVAASAAADDDTEGTADGTILSDGNLPIESESQPGVGVGIIENDVLWGRKALQQLLTSLGFKINPTETA